jgi:cytidine deaminase
VSRAPNDVDLALFAEAEALSSRAYAPYSGFTVGAVVMDASGCGHPGVNVENASYPVGLCAERAALAALVTAGERRVGAVAVSAGPGRDCLPCGMCLQALAEFGDPEIVARAGGEVRVFRLQELLAVPFAVAGGTWPGVEGGR